MPTTATCMPDVIIWLDYCHGLLIASLPYILAFLQPILHSATRLILEKYKYQRIDALLLNCGVGEDS